LDYHQKGGNVGESPYAKMKISSLHR